MNNYGIAFGDDLNILNTSAQADSIIIHYSLIRQAKDLTIIKIL